MNTNLVLIGAGLHQAVDVIFSMFGVTLFPLQLYLGGAVLVSMFIIPNRSYASILCGAGLMAAISGLLIDTNASQAIRFVASATPLFIGLVLFVWRPKPTPVSSN